MYATACVASSLGGSAALWKETESALADVIRETNAKGEALRSV